MPRAVVCLVLLTLLSGCSPGLVLNLYNATGDTLTVTNPPFRKAVTIPPNTSADVSIGTDVLVRSSRHAWQYSQRLLIPPRHFFSSIRCSTGSSGRLIVVAIFIYSHRQVIMARHRQRLSHPVSGEATKDLTNR